MYGLDKVSVGITGELKGAGGLIQDGQVKLYYHHGRQGTTKYPTDNVSGKMVSDVSYDDWGAVVKKPTLKLGLRTDCSGNVDLRFRLSCNQYPGLSDIALPDFYFPDFSCGAEIAEKIPGIAGKYGNYECVEAAKNIQKYLKKNKRNGGSYY